MTMTDDGIITIDIPDEPMALSQSERQATKGFCVICGEPTGDGRRKYCDEHKSASNSVKVGPKSKSTSRTSKTASDDQLAASFGKLLLILSLVLAWYQLRAKHVLDPNGDIADRIAMSDEEAVAIARPIARSFNATSTGMRVGKQIVDNSDLIDAGFAVVQWYKRMGETIDAATQGRVLPTKETNGNSGSSESRIEASGFSVINGGDDLDLFDAGG
jgi:hypothetical protein